MHKVQIIDYSINSEPFSCAQDQTLLDAAQVQGFKIPYACKGGGCGMCKIKVEEGAFERGTSSRDALPDSERALNFALACKTFARSDMKVRICQS